ncbi:YczE/YyaS/YitT family protein [Enterococcus sp. LJL51]|uniref:YczE/YyaS/YitT family protein n=1 Tax=Enterococcus sp. LJL51 TaxID=3416656 RepID=UPI003CF62097
MNIQNFLLSLVFYMISALGISLTIKADIGVSSFNSFNVAFSTFTSIKVGTVTTLINCLFLVICWLLDRKRTIKSYLVMLVALISFGNVINLFLYHLLAPIMVTSYLSGILLFIAGTIIAGFGTGQVLALGFLKFPIENFCALLSARTDRSFQFYRYLIDCVCILLSLLLSITYHLPIFVREGTLISLFLLSFVISWSKELRLTQSGDTVKKNMGS